MVQPVGPSEPSRILTPEGPARKAAPGIADTRLAWSVLGWFGIAAVMIGGFDILLAWYPMQSGNSAWEFGIINITIWSMPFITTGLVFLLAAGLGLQKRWLARSAGIAMLLLALAILAMLLIYALVIPIALEGTPEPAQLNVKKSIVKTVVLGPIFSAVLILLGLTALKRPRRVASNF